MITKEQWAYLAGIIDGEGTITILKHDQYKRNTFVYKPRIIVGNTDYNLIMWLLNNFDGTILKNKIRYHQRKQHYMWRIFKRSDIYEIMINIQSYLIIKKEHCNIMLQFIKERESKCIRKDYYGPYGKKELECYEKIRILNIRGIDKEVSIV